MEIIILLLCGLIALLVVGTGFGAYYFFQRQKTQRQQLEQKIKKMQTMLRDTGALEVDGVQKKLDELGKKKAQIDQDIEQAKFQYEKALLELEERQGKLKSLSDEIVKSEKSVMFNANKVRQLQTLFKSMQYSVNRYFDADGFSKEIITDNLAVEAEELLATTVKLKLHLMDIRELRKLYSQNNRVIQDLLARYKNRYTTKANATIYQLMVIALESELQNVLYNLSYSKLEKSIKDIKAITAKYQRIASDGNQSIASTVTKFIGEIEYLFIEAIKIEYEYYIQKERIKEEQKALREQMRQEAAERKLLEEERKKVENEETKYKSELSSIQELLAATDDQIKIKQLEERLAKVQAQLDEVEKKKDEIVNLQHGKAGYIYIISNLGAFGENIFKIGMTRRINPQDRIDELGDASVPFKFDIHSFIFSNNAPELEMNLHRKLKDQRVNKVNLRKEFFRSTIDEIEEIVYALEPSAEFNRTMLAEQYYQSMSVQEIPDTVEIIDDDEFLEDEDYGPPS